MGDQKDSKLKRAKPPSYDPRIYGDGYKPVPYTTFGVKSKDGTHLADIALSDEAVKGKSPNDTSREVMEFYRRTKIAETYLNREGIREFVESLKPSIFEAFTNYVGIHMAATIWATYEERMGINLDAKKDIVNKSFNRSIDHLQKTAANFFEEHPQEQERITLSILKNAVTWALNELEEEHAPDTLEAMSGDDFDDLLTKYAFERPEATDAIERALNLHAQDYAHTFVEAIDPEGLPLQDLEAFIGFQYRSRKARVTGGGRIRRSTPPDLPPSPDPLTKRTVPFASNPAVHGAIKAIFKAPKGWPADESGMPRYLHKVEGKRLRGAFSYHIILGDDSGETITLAHKDLAHNLLKEMGPDTAWLHMLLLAYSTQTKKGEAFVIPREAVYQVLGLDKRRDITRNEKDRKSFEEITRLRSIGLQIVRLQLGGKDLPFQRGIGSLWDIAWKEYGQIRLIPETVGDWEITHSEWLLTGRPGAAWADIFLYGEGPRQFGNMAREMLKTIDRRRAPLSAGLAVQLVFENRFNPNEIMRVRNRDIIDFAGGNVSPTDRRERSEIKAQVLNAIAEQARWGWTVDYSEWPDDLRPDLAADRADNMTTGDGSEATPDPWPRGYWDRFLNAVTRFITPESILEANLKATKQLPAPKARTLAEPYTATDFKEARQKLGWTQKEAAQYLGISQQMVSFFENGKREIQPSHRRKLEQALRGLK